MSTPLTKVTQAHNAYMKATTDKALKRQELERAVIEARKAGYTGVRIAQLLGVKKQAVTNILAKGR